MGAVSRSTSAVCALVVALAVVVQATSEDALVADACYLGVLVGAGAAAWFGVRHQPRGRRLIPVLIAVGLSLNALGDVLWTVLERAGAQTDASIADPAWFASYVFLCAALWFVLSRSRVGGRVDLGFAVDAVTIVVISVVVMWRFSVGAIVADDSVSPFVRVVWASYPVVDAVLLALVLRLLLSRRAWATIDAWFAVGVCLWLTADILYLVLPDDRVAITIMDSCWMLGPVLMARAVWRLREATPETAAAPASSGGWVAQVLIAVCPLMVPPALELVSDLRDRPDQPAQLLIGMMAVIALALVRTARLIRSEERAHRELEVARDAALAASRAKSMFLDNISHEMRTPLTSVLATGELLGDTPLNEFQLELLGIMGRSGTRLQTLVESVLDFSRIEAGQVVVHPVEFDLHALVMDVVGAHVPRAAEQGIEFDCVLDPRVPRTVIGDGSRVAQVLNHLLDNALKFTEKGSVHMAVAPLEEDGGPPFPGVQISVTDTGIGIREEDQGTIFDSFSRAGGSASRRNTGSGLGLALCKELTGLMGGSVEARSERGVGSAFTVRIPLVAPSEPPQPAGPGVASRPTPSTVAAS
jgi:signal transduction histidine kinase